MRHRIVNRNHQLAETAVHAVAHWLSRMNVGDRAASDLLAGLRIMVRGALRLDDHRAKPPVRPGRGPKRVVMPENGAEVGVHPPAIPDKLHCNNIISRMIMLQR